jgi:hypothetical protein
MSILKLGLTALPTRTRGDKQYFPQRFADPPIQRVVDVGFDRALRPVIIGRRGSTRSLFMKGQK